ncbi:MAG: glycerate kinase [Jatrophihabitans sp.]|nr:MAG: glycerate kinase [Jatrophihabitans sp.]
MRVVVAPDKFKGSLGAAAVAGSLAAGIRAAAPGVVVEEVPVADGGDGTVEALTRAGFAPRPVAVEGPLGAAVTVQIARRAEVAVVESAQAAGPAGLDGRSPEPVRASSYGLGQAIAAALEQGCREVVVGLGGSACTDGGAGMLQALGARLLDATGADLPRGAGGLPGLAVADLAPVRARLGGVRLVAACDVTNPLLGGRGAARVYAPQKGAGPEQVRALERGLARLAAVLEFGGAPAVADAAGAGAAGGIGYALLVLGAERRSGADLVLDLLGLAGRLAGADLAVTGEGSLDRQTLHGKAPLRVAAAAVRAGVPVVAAVGRNALTARQAARAGFARVYALSDLEPDPATCLARAPDLLYRVGTRVAADWADRPE